MLVKHFKYRRFLSKVNALTLTPVPLVSHEIKDDEKVQLLVPRFRYQILNQIFLPRNKNKVFKVSLDTTGSKVWLLIDGVKNIETLTKELTFQLSQQATPFEDAEERVVSFITELFRKDLLTFKQLDKTKKHQSE